MHILFTRPFDDCHELMLRFKSLGHMVSHIPVISIQKIIYESLDFSTFKGIIFTSTNAIKFLDTRKIDKKIKCFCVGNATEKIAKIRGFQNIHVAGGNVENLKEIIFQNFGTSDGKLIYVTGQIISSDLDKELISEGYNLKRIITTSPDVTVSTSLGGWVNQRDIFSRNPKSDIFKEKNVSSAQRRKYSPHGQHIELGIAENNFLSLYNPNPGKNCPSWTYLVLP